MSHAVASRCCQRFSTPAHLCRVRLVNTPKRISNFPRVPRRSRSGITIDGNCGAVNDCRVIAAQEKDDASDLLRPGPLREIRLGMALRLTAVSIMLGRIEFARTPVPLRSVASESNIATAAALDAAYAAAPPG